MKTPKYPILCLGRINNKQCPSKRFELTHDRDGRPRWTCLIKKCSATWVVTKTGNSPRRKK